MTEVDILFASTPLSFSSASPGLKACGTCLSWPGPALPSTGPPSSQPLLHPTHRLPPPRRTFGGPGRHPDSRTMISGSNWKSSRVVWKNKLSSREVPWVLRKLPRELKCSKCFTPTKVQKSDYLAYQFGLKIRLKSERKKNNSCHTKTNFQFTDSIPVNIKFWSLLR